MKTTKLILAALLALAVLGCGSDGTPNVPVNVPVTGVSIDYPDNEVRIAMEDTHTISATVAPGNASNKSVTWSVSDPSVITVSPVSPSSGTTTTITPHKKGSATLTVTTADGGRTNTIDVEVIDPIPVTSVTIRDKTNLNVVKGQTLQLHADVLPTNATNTLRWRSEDTSIATVTDSGVVEGVEIGEAIIRVNHTRETNRSDTVTVNVTAAPVNPGTGTVGKISLYSRNHPGFALPYYYHEDSSPDVVDPATGTLQSAPFVLKQSIPEGQSWKIYADVEPLLPSDTKGSLKWTSLSPNTAMVTQNATGYEATITAVNVNAGDANPANSAIIKVEANSNSNMARYIQVKLVKDISTMGITFKIKTPPDLRSGTAKTANDALTGNFPTDATILWLTTAANRNTATLTVTLAPKDGSSNDVIISNMDLNIYYNGQTSLPSGISALSVTQGAKDPVAKTVELNITANKGSGTHLLPYVGTVTPPLIADAIRITVESRAHPGLTNARSFNLRVVPHIEAAVLGTSPNATYTPLTNNATTISTTQGTIVYATLTSLTPDAIGQQTYTYAWRKYAGPGWPGGAQPSPTFDSGNAVLEFTALTPPNSRGSKIEFKTTQVNANNNLFIEVEITDRAGNTFPKTFTNVVVN